MIMIEIKKEVENHQFFYAAFFVGSFFSPVSQLPFSYLSLFPGPFQVKPEPVLLKTSSGQRTACSSDLGLGKNKDDFLRWGLETRVDLECL